MRLFIAIEVPDAWRAAAAAVRATLATEPAAAATLRWVAPERLHVSLRFLGEVDDAALDPLAAALAERVPPVDVTLALGAAGLFGGRDGGTSDVHTIWLGVRDEHAALAPLAARIEDAVVAAGLPPEPRPLHAHLTLARVARTATRADRRALAAAVARLDPPPAHATRVRELALVRSHLGAAPRYEIFMRFG